MAHLYDSDSSELSEASDSYLNENFPGLFNEEPESSNSDNDVNPSSPQPGPSNVSFPFVKWIIIKKKLF